MILNNANYQATNVWDARNLKNATGRKKMMIKIGYTEYQAIVITDQYDRVVCIIDTDEEGNGIVVERKGTQAHFIESDDTDFKYRINYNDDCIIVNDKEKFLS